MAKKFTHSKRRALSLLLTVLLVVSLMSMTVFAADLSISSKREIQGQSSISLSGYNAFVIKQSQASIIWVKNGSDAGNSSVISAIVRSDPSVSSYVVVSGSGTYYFSSYFSGNQYNNTSFTVNGNSLSVNGSYSHVSLFAYSIKEETTPPTEPSTEPSVTTEPPTTEAPTTEPPTTEAPTTEPPTTEAPTTEAPTTEPPTTESPTTETPTTEPPTTEAPTTEPPTTEPPTTEPPTTEPPTTEAPTTEPPTTEAPTTEPPTTETPTTEPPVVTEPPVATEPPAPQPTEAPIYYDPVPASLDDGFPIYEIPDEDVPLADQPEIEILDEEVPLADVPETGDASILWAAMSALSAGGLFAVNRKRKEEE